MWYWITISTLFILLLIVIEESIYYFWNRYVYGTNDVRRRKWTKRLTSVITFFKRKRTAEIHETKKEESAQ
ncbi:hypothetical protein [Neobacillus soli]|uniref:hypothetical protein n=1 Tax=Neobacillus soli TaxID=220688 RepID=UPI0008265C87|nr:hypothetical protein [Neobacillus soli]